MAFEWKPEQKSAIDNTGNILVSASAGSGKTTVMIERVVKLIAEKKTDVRKLIVITFTNAAAAEMKDKLIEKLYERIAFSKKEEAEYLAGQARYARTAYICTIDSFCRDIYRRFFEDVGGDPSFRVAEPGEARRIYASAADEVFNERIEKNEPEFLSLAEYFGENRSLDGLKAAVRRVQSFLDVLGDKDRFCNNVLHQQGADIEQLPQTQYLLRRLRKTLAEFGEEAVSLLDSFDYSVAAQMSGQFMNFRMILLEIIDLLRPFSTADTLHAFFSVLQQTVITTRMTGGKKNEEPPVVEMIRLFVKDFKKCLSGMKDDFNIGSAEEAYAAFCEKEKNAAAYNAALIRLTLETGLRYDEMKKEEGVCDFADLEHKALEILSKKDGGKDRAEEIKESVDYILIDEYQDTNYLQEAIINLIAKDNVFMVGDVKQSIYGFRFAEPKIFIEKGHTYRMSGGGTRIDLNYNFRSSKNILDFVNLIFNEIMTGGECGVNYRAEATLVSGKNDEPFESPFPPVNIAFFNKSEKEEAELPPVYSVKEGALLQERISDEAEFIAAAIASTVKKTKVFDLKKNVERPLEYRDIAVLMRNRGNTEIFAALDKAGIPYNAGDLRPPEADGETELLLTLLSVIDNDQIDAPLYAVLVSPIGGFSEEELYSIRRDAPARFFWQSVDSYNIPGPLFEKKQAFFVRLNRWRALSHTAGCGELLETVLAETGYDARLIANGKIAPVNAFLFALKHFGPASSISSLLAIPKEELAPLKRAVTQENAVNFYTVHQSKGLEFPVVFFACVQQGVMKGGGKDAARDVLLDYESGLALKWRDSEERYKEETVSTLALKLKRETAEKEELARLMYVAMTRAKYQLFITGESGKGAAGVKRRLFDCSTFAELILYAAGKNAGLAAYFRNPADLLPLSTGGSAKEKFPVLLKEEEPVSPGFVYPYREDLQLSNKYTVTELNASAAEETYEYGISAFKDDKAQSKGTQYHAFLQYADYQRCSVKDVLYQTEEMKKKGLLDIDFMPEPAILSNLLSDPLFDGVREGRAVREKPFMLYLPAKELPGLTGEDKVLVQGVIDLVVTGDAPALVDFKYSSLPLRAIKEKYKNQLEIYGKAVQKLLHITPAKRVIYVINTGEKIEM